MLAPICAALNLCQLDSVWLNSDPRSMLRLNEPIELDLRRVRQSGPGSYVVIYQAIIEFFSLRQTGEKVLIDTSLEPDAGYDASDLAIALKAIARGAEAALAAQALGARIQVRHLVIHPTDFRATAYERFTREAVAALLEPGES